MAQTKPAVSRSSHIGCIPYEIKKMQRKLLAFLESDVRGFIVFILLHGEKLSSAIMAAYFALTKSERGRPVQGARALSWHSLCHDKYDVLLRMEELQE